MFTILTALPEAIRSKAAQALAEAFPGSEIQSLEPLHGGYSGAAVYKLIVDGRPVVLRIIGELSPFNNPVRQFTCMQLAARDSIAPEVHHVNPELGVSITAYVEQQPVVGLLRHDMQQLAACGDLLRRLHGGPHFPVFPTVFQMIQDGREHLTRIGVTLPALMRDLLAGLDDLQPVLQAHLTSAPCHNDLNPGNVLYDGKRLWLIDWESATMGDPMFDVAGLIHWFALDERQEATLLEAYFQRIPTKHEVAKLTLMKHVSWCFYGLAFLLVSLQSDGPHEIASVAHEQLPSFADSLIAIGTGELRLHEAGGRRHLGFVIAKQALNDMSLPAFRQALACLAA